MVFRDDGNRLPFFSRCTSRLLRRAALNAREQGCTGSLSLSLSLITRQTRRELIPSSPNRISSSVFDIESSNTSLLDDGRRVISGGRYLSFGVIHAGGVSYGCIYAVGAQFRLATSVNTDIVIGQQYTRGTWIGVIAFGVNDHYRSLSAVFLSTLLRRSTRRTAAVRRVNYC